MWEILFEPYKNYENTVIYLEIVAFLCGVTSVYFAKKNNILVYPIGIISTTIYVYLLFQWELLGDMIVNIYYTAISVMGWYFWTQKKDKNDLFPISKSTAKDWKIYGAFFMITIVFIVIIYLYFSMFKSWYNYVDTFTTGLFFVAMFAMAKRRIEHWLFWIVGNIMSIPLYYFKGYTITSLQYFVFLILAILGYIEWKNTYNKLKVTSSK